RVEDRDATLELLSALPRRDPGNHRGAILQHLLRVERSVAAGDALHQQASVLVHEDAHLPLRASFTASFTASSMSVPAVNPFRERISMASSSLVPVSRMTSGRPSFSFFVAVTMPLATSSQRVMPPKMLNRMLFTFGSAVMMLSASTTFCGLLLPPMSRK